MAQRMTTEKMNIEMVERMAKLETDVGYIKKAIDSTNEHLTRTNNKFDKFVEAVDKKYANKDIEQIVNKHEEAINNINVHIAKWVGGAIACTTIITWIIAMLV